MKIVYSIILIAFLAIAVFGYTGFSTSHNTAFMQCLNTLGQNPACGMNMADMGTYHASAYLGFSLAILSILLLLLLSLSAFEKKLLTSGTHAIHFSGVVLSDYSNRQLHWLQLLQKRSVIA
jgi:hypothetical protein